MPNYDDIQVSRVAEADPIPTMLDYLKRHPSVLINFGGTSHIGGVNEPPYPHLVLTHAGSSDRSGRWLIETEVQLEVYASAIDNAPGNAELRRLLYVVIGALTDLPLLAHFTPNDVVITSVTPSTGGNFIPDITGQGRYMARVAVGSHPPSNTV